MGNAQDAGGVVRVGAVGTLSAAEGARSSCASGMPSPSLSRSAGMGAAAVTLRVRLVAVYAGLKLFAVADREAVDRGELAGARAEGHHWEAVSDGRAEAIHEGQIEHPVERGGTRCRQPPELAGRSAADVDGYSSVPVVFENLQTVSFQLAASALMFRGKGSLHYLPPMAVWFGCDDGWDLVQVNHYCSGAWSAALTENRSDFTQFEVWA